jgi:DNA-binding PadR family transcriptional regulator
MTDPEAPNLSDLDGYTIGIPAGTLDVEALRALLARHVGPGVVLVPHPRGPGGGVSGQRGLRRHELVDAVKAAMAGGQVWFARDLAVLLQRPSLGGVLAVLVNDGTVRRVGRGQYVLAGEGVANHRPSPTRGLSGLSLAVFGALETPRSLADLAATLELPRRDVANIVARLQRRRLVTRAQEGRAGGFVYVYRHGAVDRAPGEDPGSAPPEEYAVLPPFTAAALSAIPGTGVIRLTDLRRALPRPSSAPGAIARLRKLGLVRIEGSQNRRTISLTEPGRLHPQYDRQAPKVERLAVLGGRVEPAAGVLAAVGSAREVRASDLVALRPAVLGDLGFDFPIWRLVKRGLAEGVEETRGRNRLYRLTARGRDYAEELEREGIVPPGLEVKAFLARYFGAPKADDSRPQGLPAEKCRQEILNFARIQGIVTAKSTAQHLGALAPALSVIYGHLRTLEARGAIEPAAAQSEGGARAALAWRYVRPLPQAASGGN